MIDEEKLIKEMRDDLSCYETDGMKDNELYIRVDDMIRMINHQPKVGKWILCSERLPEQTIETADGICSSEPVIVTVKKGRGVCSGVDFLIDGKWACNILGDKVIAWQPLPGAYKGEDLTG